MRMVVFGCPRNLNTLRKLQINTTNIPPKSHPQTVETSGFMPLTRLIKLHMITNYLANYLHLSESGQDAGDRHRHEGNPKVINTRPWLGPLNTEGPCHDSDSNDQRLYDSCQY